MSDTLYTFQLPTGPRTFQLITEPTAAMFDFVRLNTDVLVQPPGESQEEYGRRIYAWIFSDPVRLQEVMRMALFGDHTNVEWYYHASPVQMATVFVEFFLGVLPKVEAAAADQRALEALGARARGASLPDLVR